MTITEVILCAVCFGGVSFLAYLYMARKNFDPRSKGLVIVPGFIAANIASLLISKPGDRLFQPRWDLLTDQPISIGFPLSFYEIGAFGDNRFHLIAFMIDIVLVAFLGAFFAGYLAKGRSKKSSDSRG